MLGSQGGSELDVGRIDRSPLSPCVRGPRAVGKVSFARGAPSEGRHVTHSVGAHGPASRGVSNVVQMTGSFLAGKETQREHGCGRRSPAADPAPERGAEQLTKSVVTRRSWPASGRVQADPSPGPLLWPDGAQDAAAQSGQCGSCVDFLPSGRPHPALPAPSLCSSSPHRTLPPSCGQCPQPLLRKPSRQTHRAQACCPACLFPQGPMLGKSLTPCPPSAHLSNGEVVIADKARWRWRHAGEGVAWHVPRPP